MDKYFFLDNQNWMLPTYDSLFLLVFHMHLLLTTYGDQYILCNKYWLNCKPFKVDTTYAKNNLTCFVCYLKIINTFWNNLVDQMVLELLIKAIFCMLHALVSQTIWFNLIKYLKKWRHCRSAQKMLNFSLGAMPT